MLAIITSVLAWEQIPGVSLLVVFVCFVAVAITLTVALGLD